MTFTVIVVPFRADLTDIIDSANFLSLRVQNRLESGDLGNS